MRHIAARVHFTFGARAMPNEHIARLIKEDHHRLESIITQLTTEITRVPPAAFDGWKLSLLRKLRDFQNELRKHFDLEEHGGFMEEVISHAPRYVSRVEALVSEHEEVCESLDAILTDLKAATSPAMWREARIAPRLTEMFETLKEHESEENSLIQDTYFQDLGVGD
jgi:iron-sulfur cluster repair protein YtfE (RIC family)